jgi:hypothetical protein
MPKGQTKNGQSRETGNIDENKQNKNIKQYVLDTTIHKQTQLMQIRHGPSYKQLEVKTNRTPF